MKYPKIKCTKPQLRYIMARAYMDMDILINRIPVICSDVHKKRANGLGNIKDPQRDYPAVLAECCMTNYTIPLKTYYAASDDKPMDIRYFKSPEMLNAMKAIGGVGNKSKLMVSWKIGNCAEQRAGELLLQDNPGYKISDIKLSTAIRPRTNEVIQYCKNCRHIFKI